MEHGAWSIGKYSWQRAAGSSQKSEVRDQRTGVRFSHIEILLWERLSSRYITT
jgi:hypothetical protein